MGHGKAVLLPILAMVSFFLFLYFLFKGARQKNKKIISFSIISLLLTIALSFKIDFKQLQSFSFKQFNMFQPKSEVQIYTTIFRIPLDSCVKITNTVDQIIPRVDCCVWLEFKTCPNELQKIIKQWPYQTTKYAVKDSSEYNLVSSPKPSWWTPNKLGDSIIKIKYSWNPSAERTLLFNKDSTHVYCCDRAE
jgi:hypothetical protein